MELRQLRSFLVAAEEENFRRAATRLNIAQPALSHQIANLESKLGFDLFVRSRRRVHLSPAGHQYLMGVKQVLRELDETNENARRAAESSEGIFRIGMSETTPRYPVTSSILREFHAANPAVKVRLMIMPSDVQIAALRTADIDAGFAYIPESLHPELAYSRLLTDNFVLSMSATHRLACRTRIDPADLVGEDFIWKPKTSRSSSFDQLMLACQSKGLSPKIVYEAVSEATVMELVSVGLGLAFVPSMACGTTKREVKLKPVNGISAQMNFSIVWNRADQSPLLSRFVSAVPKAAILERGSRG